MTKKKLILIISMLLFLFACEDKEEDVNPLVGQWNMTNFSSGAYMKLNKTQEIFMGDTEGSIQAKTISNGITTDTYNLTDLYIDSYDDGTFIDVSEYDNNFSANYTIDDYIESFSSYDQSRFSVYSENTEGEYYSTNFNYTISTNSLKVSPDTLYRKLYINGNEVWDSTRYAIVEGGIEQMSTMVEAGQNFLMDGDMFGPTEFPDELTLILDDDGTGRIIEKMWGQTEEIEIKWEATDSTLSWNEECNDEDCDLEVVDFTFEILSTGLSLSNYQDMCELFEQMGGEGTCDLVMNDEFGVEMGTLEGFWMEMNITFSENQVAKKSVNKMLNKRSKFGNYSFLNGYTLPKKFNQ
jgi:hypothetical protein